MDFNEDLLYAPIISTTKPGEDTGFDPTIRGFFSGVTSSAARGAVDVAKGIGAGLEVLGIDNPLYSGATQLEKDVDFLKPDIPEYFKTESAVTRGLKSIPRTVIGSAGLTVAGAMVGGIPGAIAGGVTNLGLNMGLGTYKQSYDEYLLKNPGMVEQAKEYGISQAVPEVLGELASDLVAGGLLVQTGGLSLAGKEGVKSTVRELLKTPVKDMLKTAGIGAGVELLTEEGTYVAQSLANQKYGMGDGVTAEGLIETGVATAGMSMLFGGIAAKHSYNQNKALNAAMNSGDLNMQKRASDIIYNTLEKSGDKDLAASWKTYTDTQFDLGKPIYMNDKFVEIGKQIEASKTYEVKDILSSDPTQQKEAADSLLRKAGIDVDGSLVGPYLDQENQDFAIMQRDALAYNQERNLGTKETRRQREILEGRQEVERRQAERDAIASSRSLDDPIVLLNNLYNEQEYQSYDPSQTDVYKFKKDLFEVKDALSKLSADEATYQEEEAAKQFEEVASRYTKDKNQVRVIADLLQSPDDQLKLKMFQLMQELEPDSSNVSPEFITQLQEEANTQAKKNADKGNLTLENYLRKKEADRRGRGIGDLGYTMSEEDRVALAQAKKIVTKGIKGSAQVEKAKATIQKIEAKAAIPQVQAVTQTPLVSEPTRSTEEVPSAPTNPDEYTKEDVELPGVGTGVEEYKPIATNENTPELEAMRKEAIEKNPSLELAGQDWSESQSVLMKKAGELKDPVLQKLFSGDYKSIPFMLKGIEGKALKQKEYLDALKISLRKIDLETAKIHKDFIKTSIGEFIKATKPRLTKEVEGARAHHRIQWNPDQNKDDIQDGVHKETGQKFTILKTNTSKKGIYNIYVGNEKKGTVTGSVKARIALEEFAEPLKNTDKESATRGYDTVLEEGETPLSEQLKVERNEQEIPEEQKPSEVRKLNPKDFKVVNGRLVSVSEESTFTPEEIDKYLNEIREDARMYFLDNKGDRQATIQAVKAAGYDGVSEGLILDHIETMQYRTADDVIANVLNNVDSKSREGRLATFLKILLDKSNKGNTSVIYDTLRTTSSYTSWGDGGIFLNDKQNYTVALHEVWHAVVNKGLEASPSLRSEVVKVMNKVEDHIKKTDSELYKIVQEMREKNITTSRQFKDYYGYNDFNGKRELAYAMLNPKEFLAQVGNSKQVGDFYSSIELQEKRKGIIKTPLDFIKEFILEIFGKSKMYMNTLEKVLDLSQQLSQVEVNEISHSSKSKIYKAVDITSSAFREWFKGSKIIDKNKIPLIVYHGTEERIEAFNQKNNNYYFTSNPELATEFGSSNYPVYLNINNPLIIDAKGREFDSIEITKDLSALAKKIGIDISYNYPTYGSYKTGSITTTDHIANLAKKAGYDGVIIKNVVEGLYSSEDYKDMFKKDGDTTYIAFSPLQIKSSISNSGSFSSKNKNISDSDKSINETSDSDRNEYLDPLEKEALEVQKGIEGKSLIQAADFISKNSPNESYKLIAEKVKEVLSRYEKLGAKLNLTVAHLNDRVPVSLLNSRGISSSNMKDGINIEVWINGSDVTGKVGVSYETVLHELVHAATQAALFIGNRKVAQWTDLGKSTSELFKVTNEIVNHFNNRIKDLNNGQTQLTPFEERIYQRLNNSINNEHEVLAWAFTNKEMQNYLEGIKINRDQTFWSKFVSAVRSLLGLSPENNTALSEVLRLGEEIFNAPVDQIMSMVDVINGKTTTVAQTDAFTMTSENTDLAKQEEKAERRERFLNKGIEEVKKIQDTPNRKEQVIEFFKKTEKGISKAFQPIYDVARNILPAVAEKLRDLDRTENEKIVARTRNILPFYNKFLKLTDHAKAELSFLLQNYNVEGVDKRVKERLESWGKDSKTPDIYKDFLKVIETLEEIKDDADVASLLKYNLVDNYFPRKIKDYPGLVAYLRNRTYYPDIKALVEKNDIKGVEEYLNKNGLYDEVDTFFEKKEYDKLVNYLKERYDWGTFDEAIKEAEEKADKDGRSFTDQDRAEVVGKIIASGRKPAAFLRTPTGVKKRSISRINPTMMKFYYDPMDALSMHIREMTSRIEINKMLGITKNNKLMQEFNELSKKQEVAETQKEKDKIQKRLDEIFNEMPSIDKIVDDSIGHLITQESKEKKLGEEDQRRLTDVIRARITTKHMSPLTGLIRQGALLGSLTQIGTGIRNLTDSINFMYASGMMNALQAAMHVASKKALVKDIPFDFYQPLKEFSTTNRWVDRIMRASGLYYVDAFFKETGMEAAIIKAKQQKTEEFVNEWKDRYGEKGAATLHNLIEKETMTEDGKLPELVRRFLYAAIADWQPVGLSEMPELYNKMGDGRLMYFLKSYSIKQANNFYRESIKKIRNGEKAQGFKNLVHLGFLFMIAGASTDWLVDWINGREPDFSDSMLDTLLTLGLSSRYTLEKGKKEGILRSHLYNIIPPTGLIEYPLTDLIDLLSGDSVKGKTLKLVPGGGSIIYNNLTEAGKKAIINDSKRRVYEEIKDNNKVDYDRIRRINREVIDFNKRFTPEEKMKPITPGTITSIKKQEQEKKRKGK